MGPSNQHLTSHDMLVQVGVEEAEGGCASCPFSRIHNLDITQLVDNDHIRDGVLSRYVLG